MGKKIITNELEDFEAVKALVIEHINLIEIDKNAYKECEARAAKFLMVQAVLNDFKLDIEERVAQQKSVATTQYAMAMNEAAGSNAQQREANAKADDRYIATQEFCENLRAALRWVDTNLGIFTNAHILFRQIAQKE